MAGMWCTRLIYSLILDACIHLKPNFPDVPESKRTVFFAQLDKDSLVPVWLNANVLFPPDSGYTLCLQSRCSRIRPLQQWEFHSGWVTRM